MAGGRVASCSKKKTGEPLVLRTAKIRKGEVTLRCVTSLYELEARPELQTNGKRRIVSAFHLEQLRSV